MSVTGDLERYRTISTIGTGGMARVDLAEDTRLGREVALKRIPGLADHSGLTRLRREALVGASVSHPNLVSIFDVVGDVASGGMVIVMEYVPGETLRDRLNREGRLPAPEALRILDEVAAGLDAIHARGIVHRDVKPSNILLGEGGQVKVADLGIASVPDQTRITTSGAIVGSLSYMAPEQLGDSVATPAIDIYALATVAWEMLSGGKARTAPNAVALAHEIASQPAPDLREVWPEAPPAAAQVLRDGMARDPRDRPATAGELIARLRSTLIEEPTQRQARRPSRVAAAAIPALSAGALPAAAAAEAPAGEASRAARSAGAARGAGAAVPAGALGTAAAPAAARGRRPSGPPGRSGSRRPPAPPPDSGRSHGGLIAGGLIALVAASIAAAVILSGSGSSPSQRVAATGARTPARHRHTPARTVSHPATSPASGSATTSGGSAGTGSTGASSSPTSSTPASSVSTASSASGAAGAPSGGSGGAGDPASAVRSFYELAAAHNYSSAWALGDASLHSELEGYNSFVAGQSGDRSIIFHTDRVVSQSPTAATVDLSTTSNRTNGTQQCQGTADLVRGSSGWLVHLVQISCTPAS